MTKTLTEQWREGNRFGKLTVLGFHHKDKHYHRYYECVCDCGKKTIVNESNLKRGLTKSCGCGIVEALVWRNKNIKQKDKHKYEDYSLYPLWKSIRSRCLCKTEPAYKDYGGRGICICNEWKENYPVFLAWAKQNGYKEGLTIDRIDTNGNYCPENCRWATRKEQGQNTRKNIVITFKGTTKTMGEWAKYLNGNRGLIRDRIKLGWSIEEALTTPVNKARVWEKQKDGTYHHKEEK